MHRTEQEADLRKLDIALIALVVPAVGLVYYPDRLFEEFGISLFRNDAIGTSWLGQPEIYQAVLQGGVPSLFLFLVLVRLLTLVWRRRSVLFHACLAAALFVAVPAGLNGLQHGQGFPGQANGFGSPGDVHLTGSVGEIRRVDRAGPAMAPIMDCEELCLRLLLNGTVREFFVVRLTSGAPLPAGDWPVTRHRLAPRETCRHMPLLVEERYSGSIPYSAGGLYPAEHLVARMVASECLVAEAAVLADADHVLEITREFARKPDRDGFAVKLSVYQPAGGAWRETYRATKLSFLRYAVPMRLHENWQYELLARGAWRIEPHMGAERELLAGLGAEIDIRPDHSPDVRAGLRTALADGEARPGDLRFAAARTWLHRIANGQTAAPRDAALAAALMEDPRVSAGDFIVRATAALAAAAPDDGRSLAAAALGQIARPDATADDLNIAGKVIANLPRGALDMALPALSALARDPDRRDRAPYALVRLAEFGPAGADVLMQLLKDGVAAGKTKIILPNGLAAALTGLCRAGPDAAAHGSEFMDLYRAGKLKLSHSLRWTDVIGQASNMPALPTAVAIGIPLDDIWPLFQADGYTRGRFDRYTRRLRRRAKCDEYM